ncbi:MAG: SOS response-associated peptidase, partial [Hyphomonas sp.]
MSWEAYYAWLGITDIPGVEPPEADWNIAPTTIQPVIRLNHDRSAREMAPARWGLVPSWWSKPLKEWRAISINARAEDVAEKPTFRGAYRHKRCLVPVSGYYEWSVQGKSKTPFVFRLRNRRLFCLAGLWDAALIDGSEIQSFTILTTKPNDFTAGIHDRMPVILPREQWTGWLEGSEEEALALARTCDLELAVERTEALWVSGAMPAQ